MTIDKLRRVVWRLQELHTPRFSLADLRKAVMYECGTDERTIKANIKKLKELEFIHCRNGRCYEFGSAQV
jgi:hypothetical protein